MGIGAGAGLGITGYYQGKKLRDESTSRDAAMRIQELEDQITEMEQANKKVGVIENYGKNRSDHRIEQASRQGRLTRAGYENNRAIREENTGERTEQTDEAGHLGAMETARNTLPGAIRTEEIAGESHEGAMVTARDSANEANRGIETKKRAATREEQVAGQEASQVRAGEIYNSVPEVLRSFEASGYNGKTFDDWYDKWFPNDHNIDTVNDPDVPGGYIQTDNNGTVHKVANKEDLLAGFNKAFGDQNAVNRMMGLGNLGRYPGSPSNRGQGISGPGGIGGSGGGRGTFNDRMMPSVMAAMKEENPDASPGQLVLLALDKLKQTGSPDIERFFIEIEGKMMQAAYKGAGSMPGELEEALAEVARIMTGLREKYGNGRSDGEGGVKRAYDDPEEFTNSLYDAIEEKE